ncbi:hypothetical protein X777_02460 [Ooceraea biroi]|uniref:F-box domain-containing protein n=1 Tax=Ooceraea biroi TaxID=2015173 RepID=A0A026WN06_OOCBI|nr:hypothetical protein X777_02460 [Ooceraea biroi]
MMEEMESVHVNSQTPCFAVDTSGHGSHGSCDSMDSGYLSTLTPHTSSYVSSGYRTRSSSGLALSAKKQHRFRPDALRCERLQRRRPKPNCLSHTLETDYTISDCSVEDHGLSMLEPSCTDVGQSLVHSTPSGHKVHNERGKAALDRNWRTTVLITPASITDFRLMSPSPAVPSSSYVATEPIQEEDVEMKLVETLNGEAQLVLTPPRLRIPVPRIAISPIRRRSSPIAITSAENRKLRELYITDLAAAAEIKPKKLDFSQRGLSAVPRSSGNGNEAISIYAGKEKVDFLSLLGEKSNHLNVVSKIFSFLGDEELCIVARVSSTWKQLCENDYIANKRRKRFLLRKQTIKENVKIIMKKSKGEEDMQTSPRSRHYVRKGCLIDVKNLLNTQVQRKPPSSPPVSPSKVKFHSFVKVS